MSRFRPMSVRRAGIGAPRGALRKLGDVALALAILGLLALVSVRLDRVETRQASGAAVVNDGDSITISGQRIRLRGIDAPEYAQICRRAGADYRCGQAARQALVDLIGGRAVSCSGWERDRYGRLLGACEAGEVDLNRMLVLDGWAVAYGAFDAEEKAARDNSVGLWAGEFDRPRDWRRTHGGMAEGAHDAIGAIINGLREIFRLN